MSKKKDDCMEKQPGWYNGQFLDEVGFCCDFICRHPMVCVGGKFFSKEGRIHDENGIKKQIYEMLRPYLKVGLAKKCSNLLEMLRMEAYKENLPVHEDRLHVANGTLFVKGEFTEHKEFCRNRLPVKYNPDAPQPVTWLHFLSELLEDEDILTLQEYLGYCLIPTTRGQTMMLLKGNGGEGKSRIGVVMQAMLGANLKNGSIAKVERSPFARADLEHELVMVDDDMKMEALKSTHYLKSLITAEMPMDLERKGEQSYQGEMYVRFLAFSNGDLESLYDHSDGFYRRQLILSVKKKPLDREDDPFLADKLVAEVEGIFLWCLDGLRRLIANNYRFSESNRTKDNLPVHEDRLHVANGTLFVKGEFTEHKEFCRNRLPVKYNPDAPQPVTWLHFLSELLEDEDILTLQEYLGYCLIPTTRGQTMMLLKGNGGEGKSRIGVVMQAMLGANLKNGSIAKVERSPFARADLEHELVMVDDDMKMEALKSTHYLKSLITAEMPMDLERKGEQSYQGEMYVRFLAFSNGDLESLYDHSDGFYRRQLILSVKKKPLDREDDPFLADKLVAEVDGIFLWCLDGLRRLIANNYRFSESRRTKDNREQARRDADNVLLFLRSEGYIRLKADSTITSADLYAIYCIWCNDNTYKPLAARTVSMTLKKHADEFGLEHDNHITNSLGKQVNGFWGIEALISPGIL